MMKNLQMISIQFVHSSLKSFQKVGSPIFWNDFTPAYIFPLPLATLNRFGESGMMIVFNVWWVKSSHINLICAHEYFS